ncbi:MAG TPA: DMT family transporter, partial [Chloroflexaceae bacterium]|nr:DMT family transporter [Chloroflexaceae bacterium]
ARMLIAGGVLLGYALLTRHPLPDLRSAWPAYLTLGALNSALPLALEAFAVVELSASLAAILAATVPLFTVLAAAVWLRERLTVAKVAGVLLGMAGVAVLVGGGSVPTGAMAALAVGAMLLAALLYALGGIYTRVAFSGTSPLALSIGQEVLAGLLLLPFALAAPSTGVPATPAVLAATLTLALVMTAGGNLLFFALIARAGPTRTQVVGFLIPVVALLAGALLLGEPVGAGTLAGLAAIFAGVGLVLRPQHGARTSITPHGNTPDALARPALPAGPLYDRHSRRRIRSRQGLAAGA